MGAGVSVANNAAQAVASAVTSVVNSTNVFNEQSNDQKQDIVLNACDIVAQKNVNINQTTGLQQSLTQIATIASTTSVSNDVAQALSQAAASQVGAGVLGVADASNMASTYASMATNVSNYVQLSAKQLSKTQQTFECNDSTIVGNNITISQVQVNNVTQFTNDNVSNSTDVTNKIQQTIEQTASATTGFTIGGIIALIVALAVIALAVKMFSKPNNPNDPNDPNQTHSQRILNAVQQGHTHDTVVDLDNVRVSKATWIIYGVMIVLFGLIICAWYISAGMQGCLFDDACGTRVGAVGGCSCNFNETGDGTNVCKDTTSASFTSTGIPLKYQYVLPFRQAQSVMCASAGSTSTASMQGILVSYFKTQSMTINANNGKNLDTLLRYVQMCAGAWPSGSSVPSLSLPGTTRAVQSIVNMFRAGAKYLATLTDASDSMKLLTSCLVKNDDNYVQSGIRLALLCCPLRPVFVTTSSSTATTAVPATWPNSNLTQTCLTVDTTDATSVSNWTSSADLNGLPSGSSVYLVRIPQAFTSVIPPDWPGGTDTNANAGCCSTRMMWYMDSTVAANSSFDFTCACGDASSGASSGGDPEDPTTYYLNTGTFCNGCASSDTSCAPKNNGSPGSGVAGATTTGKYVDSQTGQVKMKLPGATLPNNCTNSSTGGGAGVASMMDAYPLTAALADNWGLQYYAELATFNFGSDEDAQQAYSFVRLMWTGIMAAIGDQPADTVFGTNCMLVNPGAVDHYYVADQTGQGFGKVGSSLDDQAGMVDDKTLLRIKLMNASKYDCKLGLPPVACSGIGDTGQTQSYIGSSAALGYCRDWFLNDYSRIVMFVLAALAVLWLPMFVVVRIYINRGTGKILVQDAQAHLKKSGKSVMVAPFVNGHPQPDQHVQTTPISKPSLTSSTSSASSTNPTSQASPTRSTNPTSPTSPDNSANETNTNPTNSTDSGSPPSPNSQMMVAPFTKALGNPQQRPLNGGQSRPNKRRPAWLSLPKTAKR